MLKKGLSVLLVLVMLLTALPLTVFADEAEVSTYKQLWQAIYSKKSPITLTNDITYEVNDEGNQPPQAATYLNKIDDSASITIDLNGHTVYFVNESQTYPQTASLFGVEDDASLSVYDGTITLYNKYRYDNMEDRTRGGVFSAVGNSYLTLTNVSVNVRSMGPGIKTGGNATVTVEGSDVTASNGFALYDGSNSNASIFLDKNVKLKTLDGSGVATQFGNTGYGSAHITTPNLAIISATFTSGVEASEQAVSAFAPSSNKYLFVENKEYTSAFGMSNSGDYYWYNCTGGYALVPTGSGSVSFAKNIQIISKTAKNYVIVQNGTASPNYAAYGQKVTVTASKISGKAFAYWVNPSANIAFDNAWSETTTFTMGADPVEIKAIYDKVLTTVTNAKINVKTPKGGQKLSVPTSASDALTIEEYYWIELYDDDSFSNVLPEDTVVQAGHRYKLFVVLDWDDTEYSVDENSKIKYYDSEKGTSVETVMGVTNKVRLGTFTADSPEEIKNASATVNGISAGVTTGSTTVTPASDDYFTTIYGWYNTDNAFTAASDPSCKMTASDKFTAGDTYVVAVRFVPNGENVLASTMSVLINGEDGMIGSYDSDARIFYAALTVPENKNGFVEENDNVYYYKDNQIVKGWFYDNGKKYYSDDEGIVQYGWTDVDGNLYYLNEAEGYVMTGFKAVNGKTYYFNADGIMQTGWQKIKRGDGKFYYHYFGTDGVMRTEWQKIKRGDGKIYFHYFGANGCMRTGWQKIKRGDGKTYLHYFGTNGCMVTGWQSIKNSKGVAYKYYFGTNGCMRTGWQSIKNSKGVAYKYYFGDNGYMRTNWQWIANSKGVKYRYYFGANGVMRTGWQSIKASNGKTYKYYFFSNGVNAINRNVKIGNKTYKFNKYGICTNA